MSDNQIVPNRDGSGTMQLSAEEALRIQAQFFAQVYGWMAVGLALTGGMALFTAATPALQQFVFGTRFVFLGLIILELVVVGFLSARIFQWSRAQAQAAFIGYALLNGVTLSVVFLAYTADSIASTFFTTALMFGVMSAFGYFTKTASEAQVIKKALAFHKLFTAQVPAGTGSPVNIIPVLYRKLRRGIFPQSSGDGVCMIISIICRPEQGEQPVVRPVATHQRYQVVAG